MPDSLETVPLLKPAAAAYGLLAGGLIGAGLFSGYGFPAQAVLFLLGFLIFLDTVIPRGRDVHIITSMLFLVFGAIASFGLSFYASGLALFLLIIFIMAVIMYGVRAAKLLK
jgi:hypothetical protein